MLKVNYWPLNLSWGKQCSHGFFRIVNVTCNPADRLRAGSVKSKYPCTFRLEHHWWLLYELSLPRLLLSDREKRLLLTDRQRYHPSCRNIPPSDPNIMKPCVFNLNSFRLEMILDQETPEDLKKYGAVRHKSISVSSRLTDLHTISLGFPLVWDR